MEKVLFLTRKYGKKNEASKSWNEELLTFEWIKDVKALGTNKARIFCEIIFANG